MNTPRLKHGLFLFFLLCTAVFLGVISTVSAATNVFINEIHYDNTGADIGEAIEIAGPAGTNLSGWSVVFYNGSGGAPYATLNLSGIISDQQNGFGTLSFALAGIQNGSPDGLALVDPTNTALQFLSYEGVFVAVGGAANGLASTDIGVAQDGSGADGNSLQLTGNGTTYEDFIWATETANTFGTINTGQNFIGGPTPTPSPPTPSPTAPPSPSSLVINEIDYDQPSTDTAEFVEIKNIGTTDANLSEFTLELVNGNAGGAAIYQTIALPSVTLFAGDYFVVCADENTVANCDLDVSPDSNLIQNGAPDAVGLRYLGTLIDAVSYEGDSGAPYTEGTGTGLEDPGTTGSDNLSIARFPDGVDTNQNNVDLSQRCITPGTANSSATTACPIPQIGSLVINEIDYDQAGTDTAEFVEIYNASNVIINLSTYELLLVNGNGAAVYSTTILPNINLNPGQYFVVCGDAANVSNCDLDITPDSNLIQNGPPDAVTLVENGVIIDTVSYEGDVAAPYTEGSGTGLEDVDTDGYSGISRFPDGTDTDQNNIDLNQYCATPGEANTSANTGCTPPVVEVCGDAFTPIYNVQGNGASSPLVGTEVAIEGIVVGDFQNNASVDSGNLNGFHVQDPAGDGDAATSDGIFVFAPSGMDVSAGDAVRVRGSVSEFNGMTEITAVQIWSCSIGNPLPTPAQLSLPVTSVNDFEPFEGMYVTFPQELVISEYFNFDRFNETVLTSERRLTPTAEFEPGPAAIQAAQAFLLDSITLDDGRSNQNPDPAIHPNGNIFDLTNLFRGGDTLQSVTGVMDYSFNLYRIQPTQGAVYTSANPRTTAPDPVGGDITVASFNVLNYFTTLDDGVNDICGPLQNQECRGADDANEFTRQRDKIIAALIAINADVVGLIEIENHPADVPTADLVSGLNNVLGAGTYDYIATSAIGSDAIRMAFIYKPASVSPVGSYAVLDTSVDPRFLDDFNRPTLAQSFQENATGSVFTVAVNHLKSKGSDCNGIGDPDLGDGAGNCNLTRKAAAEAMVDWLATDPTGSGDSDFLIIGDLNSYDKEDPIDAILAGSDDLLGSSDDYTDLLYTFIGEDAYSYVFDGQTGYLDHGLANAALLPQVTGTTVWHINADEADLIDYDTSFKGPNQDAIYAPDAYRSSDHDPVIIGLDLSPYTYNPDGCIVLALEGSPYAGSATAVSTIHNKFFADRWAWSQGLPQDTCFEIHGTDGKDTIYGAKGDDTIFGYGNKDNLLGGKGNDTLFGGDDKDALFGEWGDYDYLDGGDDKDFLIDLDGVSGAHGGNDDDIIIIILRPGWRDVNGNAIFANALSGGYGNDHVTLTFLDKTKYLIDVTGDEQDNPPVAAEGKHDFLKVYGKVKPGSVIIKFEHTMIH